MIISYFNSSRVGFFLPGFKIQAKELLAVREDVTYSVQERMEIRRDAEAILEVADVKEGSVVRIEAASMYNLISVLLKAEVPLTATCYDLADFYPLHVSRSEQNLLRFIDDEKTTRVMEPAGGLVLRFPSTVGQAPVIYLAFKQRLIQPDLKLSSFLLPEWSQPVQFHIAFLHENGIAFRQAEVDEILRRQMLGEAAPPEIYSYLSKGIGMVLHVAPKTFQYRYPEFSLEKIAHWSLDDLQEETTDLMQRLILKKSGLSEEERKDRYE